MLEIVSLICPISVERSASFWMTSAEDVTESAISDIWLIALSIASFPLAAIPSTLFAASAEADAFSSKPCKLLAISRISPVDLFTAAP